MSLEADANCHYGDHYWSGGKCTNCYERFRCACGRFLRVEDIDRHIDAGECPTVPPCDEVSASVVAPPTPKRKATA